MAQNNSKFVALSLFLLISVTCSVFESHYVYIPVKKDIPNYENFQETFVRLDEKKYYYSKYSYLQDVYEEYTNLLNKADFFLKLDATLHYVIGPTFMALSFFFSWSYIFHKIDRLQFVIWQVLSLLIKALVVVDKYLYEFKRSKLSTIDFNSNDLTIIQFFKEYEEYQKKKIFDFYLIFGICSWGAELIMTFIIACINWEKNKKTNEINNNGISNEENKKIKILQTKAKNKQLTRMSVMYYLTFGVLSFLFFNFAHFLYPDCLSLYKDYFKKDEYLDNYNHFKFELYPVLKEIFNIYFYKKETPEKAKKSEDNMYLAILCVSLAYSLITYLFLLLYKFKDISKVFFITLEFFSVGFKIFIIFYPYTYTKKGFKSSLVTDLEEIKYIVEDYNQYAKCRNKFPLIIIVEIVYLIIELCIMFCIFKEYKVPKSPAAILISEQNKLLITKQLKSNHNNSKEIKKINFKSPQIENKVFIFEVEPNRRFIDVLKNLLKKYSIFKNYRIKYITYSKEIFYSLYIFSRKTIQELNLREESYFTMYLEKIIKEESYSEYDEIISDFLSDNDSINKKKQTFPKIKFKEKKKKVEEFKPIPNFIILHFTHITLGDNKIYDLNISTEETFSNAVNKLKEEYPIFKEYSFEEIFYDNKGETEILQTSEALNNKKIKKLNIDTDEIIYIKGDTYSDNIIELNLIWSNKNDKKYIINADKKEIFHEVIRKFEQNYGEFEDNIITNMYTIMEKKEIVEISKKNELAINLDKKRNIRIDTERLILKESIDSKEEDEKSKNILRIKKMIKNIESDNKDEHLKYYKYILERENNFSPLTIEELNFYNGIEIIFSTKENISTNEFEKIQIEQKKYLEYILSGEKVDGKQYIIFKYQDIIYPLFVKKNMKIIDAVSLIKKEYPNEIKNIKSIFYDKKNLYLENYRYNTIEELNINETTSIINLSSNYKYV